jgi:hypothetical protein
LGAADRVPVTVSESANGSPDEAVIGDHRDNRQAATGLLKHWYGEVNIQVPLVHRIELRASE